MFYDEEELLEAVDILMEDYDLTEDEAIDILMEDYEEDFDDEELDELSEAVEILMEDYDLDEDEAIDLLMEDYEDDLLSEGHKSKQRMIKNAVYGYGAVTAGAKVVKHAGRKIADKVTDNARRKYDKKHPVEAKLRRARKGVKRASDNVKDKLEDVEISYYKARRKARKQKLRKARARKVKKALHIGGKRRRRR